MLVYSHIDFLLWVETQFLVSTGAVAAVESTVALAVGTAVGRTALISSHHVRIVG